VREPSPYFIDRTVPLPPGGAIPLLSEDPRPIGEYIAIARRHFSLISSIVTGVLLLTALVVFTMTPQYTAQSTIMIERQVPQVLDMKDLMPETSENEHDYYYTQYELLKSRTLASQVIRDLSLQDTRPIADDADGLFRAAWEYLHSLLAFGPSLAYRTDSLEINGVKPRVIDNYLKHLTITPETFTRLVKVSFTTPDPSLSAQIANAHVAAYIRRGMEMHAESSEEAQRFLEGKLIELRERVEKSEAALNAYRHERGIVGFAIDDKDRIVLQRTEDLNKALTEASTARIGLEAEVETIKHGSFESVPDVVSSPLIQHLKEDYSSIEAQYSAMADQFTPDYPPLAQIRAKRVRVEDRLREEVEKIAASIRAQYRAATRREEKLQHELAKEKARIMALQNVSLKDGILAREVDTNRELYKSVLERMKQMGVAAQVRASNVSIVDQAETPEYSSSPRKLMALGLFGSLALIIGIAAAFFIDYLDDTLRTSDDVDRYLNLPSLGMVPDFNKTNGRLAYGRQISRMLGPNGHSGAQLEGTQISIPSTEIFVSRNPFSVTSEAYRAIRAAIMLSRAESPPKTILIVSATGREGKTVTAVNTAVAFGQLGGRVLLIDADLRRSRCHKVLGIDNHIGLSEVLTGLRNCEDLLRPTANEGVFCLTAGSTPPNPCELLGSKKMAELLRNAGDDFDHIIIDSAPLGPVTDSLVLSTVVEGVVVVVGSTTPKQVVRGICDSLHRVGANILGVVLNRVNVAHSGYGYGSYTYNGHYQPDEEQVVDDSSQPAA
jgi:succinoglycan biosynthesis transport protein ExoP